ncbi:MAG: glycerophosphodiester phosphodiesterase family protein [Nanoarchaeota archaeon]
MLNMLKGKKMKSTGNKNRKNKVILIILSLVLISLVYLFFYEPSYSGPIENSEKTLIISHRSFGNHAPDNSLTGAKLALANGLDGIDVDGQMTSDGELIIFHDLTLGRLTNGTGKVNDTSLDYILSLDLGKKFKGNFNGSYVATFEDFLNSVNGSAIYMVELKVASTSDTGIEKRAAEIIDKYNAYNWVYLSSFNPVVLHRLEKIDSRINTVFIFMDTNWNKELLAEIEEGVRVDLPWFLRQEPIRRAIRKIIAPDLLSVNHKVDEETINRLIKKGYPIFLWSPNNQSDINYNLNKKPYGIITDEPLLGKELRDKI